MGDRLRGRVVLVTGAAGIGAATARNCAREGATLFVVSLDPAEIRAVCAEAEALGATADGVAADLRDEEAADRAFTRCLEAHGRIDGTVAVAGASGRRHGDGPVHDIPLTGWEATVDLNMTPMFLTVRGAVRAMIGRGGGSIAVVSSVLARHPSPLFVTHAYAAAKSSALGFVRSVAAAYAGDGIRCNVVAPGLVATPMSERAASDPASVAYATAKQPLAGGFLPPESVAATALFLMSDESRHLTGQLIEVDGGWGVTEARS